MRLHRDDFEMLKVIGRGAFGEVRNPCVVKRLSLPNDFQEQAAFLACFKAQGNHLWNHCRLCHIVRFVLVFLSFVFMTHFACPTKTPKYQRSICVPLKHLIGNRKLTPSSHLIFSSLPLPILRGPGLALDCYSWAGTNLGILDGWFVLQRNVLLVLAVKGFDIKYLSVSVPLCCSVIFCSASSYIYICSTFFIF